MGSAKMGGFSTKAVAASVATLAAQLHSPRVHGVPQALAQQLGIREGEACPNGQGCTMGCHCGGIAQRCYPRLWTQAPEGEGPGRWAPRALTRSWASKSDE